ncbi:predicted protein [Sclerotinia sclerotiorum 1980 UF-70]|uniref:Uncharacterized protein n=1 Tax=Sclerotinia sclerotiorum (strain ATCC 18683 / 1980 / Ss-1) TaxID=665079 RepID=A7F542_SCLS1|nr:predicted protein [Sclerotinia sclerotiorum 1980 UF-70]EDN97863.1 predicted protein [Sclerotinia sclerotiorum 1980 UF-70]
MYVLTLSLLTGHFSCSLSLSLNGLKNLLSRSNRAGFVMDQLDLPFIILFLNLPVQTRAMAGLLALISSI